MCDSGRNGLAADMIAEFLTARAFRANSVRFPGLAEFAA